MCYFDDGDNEDFALKGCLQSPAYTKIARLYEDVMKKIPEEEKSEIHRKNIVAILADKTNSYCCPVYFPQRGREITDLIEVNLIIFSPQIVKRTKPSAIYTIAHELAHAFLGHGITGGSMDMLREREIEADQQVIKWGFEKELKADPDNYIYGNGLENTFG